MEPQLTNDIATIKVCRQEIKNLEHRFEHQENLLLMKDKELRERTTKVDKVVKVLLDL